MRLVKLTDIIVNDFWQIFVITQENVYPQEAADFVQSSYNMNEKLEDFLPFNYISSEYKLNAINYIAGFIQKKIASAENCSKCLDLIRKIQCKLESF